VLDVVEARTLQVLQPNKLQPSKPKSSFNNS
jgi:hypothetical protein